MPRPSKLAEQAKIQAWAIAHPRKEQKMSPEHHVLPKEWRLWLWAAALALALFILAPKLSGDRVTVLFIVSLFVFLFLLLFPLRHLPWILEAVGRTRQKRAWGAVALCVALTVVLGWVAWPDVSKKVEPQKAENPPDKKNVPESHKAEKDDDPCPPGTAVCMESHGGSINGNEFHIKGNPSHVIVQKQHGKSGAINGNKVYFESKEPPKN